MDKSNISETPSDSNLVVSVSAFMQVRISFKETRTLSNKSKERATYNNSKLNLLSISIGRPTWPTTMAASSILISYTSPPIFLLHFNLKANIQVPIQQVDDGKPRSDFRKAYSTSSNLTSGISSGKKGCFKCFCFCSYVLFSKFFFIRFDYHFQERKK